MHVSHARYGYVLFNSWGELTSVTSVPSSWSLKAPEPFLRITTSSFISRLRSQTAMVWVSWYMNNSFAWSWWERRFATLKNRLQASQNSTCLKKKKKPVAYHKSECVRFLPARGAWSQKICLVLPCSSCWVTLWCCWPRRQWPVNVILCPILGSHVWKKGHRLKELFVVVIILHQHGLFFFKLAFGQLNNGICWIIKHMSACFTLFDFICTCS
jgi:hypothetical protein